MYNGYKNYYTWNAALWFSNDREQYGAALAISDECKAIEDKAERIRREAEELQAHCKALQCILICSMRQCLELTGKRSPRLFARWTK